MNFSFFLFSALISTITSARVMNAGYDLSTLQHAYNFCEDLIKFENKGFELPEATRIFLFTCSHKFRLARRSVNFRTMMFNRVNPGKVYEYIG